ncbi:hypothetical protein FPOA_12182 [Fusarium poae]|uniref:Uncharacterized protein n=2 Tax=Fusarium poae TaxID=36050 RepID=A0A1B8A761_FUSPO|nr:hypothetical protein FPOA_13020 [Fusarium poae]OBS17309.1 hypothetical protein FPOA_12182 [Fusarium poae]
MTESQALDLPTFLGLEERIEANPWPSACQAFKTISISYDDSVGEDAEIDSAHLSTSSLPQCYSRLVESKNAITQAEHQLRLAAFEHRVDGVMLAMEYNEKLNGAYEKYQRELKGADAKHTDDYGCLQSDTVIDEIIQEGFLSTPFDDYSVEEVEFLREKLPASIGLGQFFLKLIAEFGWGAMVVPGLFIELDDLKEIGQEELDEIMELIHYHYGTKAWRKELLDISPTVFTLITQGIPEGQTLKILTVPDGGETGLADSPLSEWFRFIPITNGRPYRAPESRFLPREESILRRVPCPASTIPELEGQKNTSSVFTAI